MSSLLGTAKLSVLRGLVSAAPSGILIEVGVYRGGSLLEIAQNSAGRLVYGFDTFEGMPPNYFGDDEHHKPGEFKSDINAVKVLLEGHSNVHLIQGVFPTSAIPIRDNQIAFAHLDMDHWRGTLAALNFIWPRLMTNGCILFDDYNWKKCPGIAPVVESWATAMGWAAKLILFSEHHQAAIIKNP